MGQTEKNLACESFLYLLCMTTSMTKIKDEKLVEILRRPEVKAFIHSPALEGYVERFIQNLAPNGVLERWGPTPECIDLPVYDNYVAGKLSAEERKKVDQHMAGCRPCYDALEELFEAKERLATLEPRTSYTKQAISAIQQFAHYVAELVRKR